MASEFDALFGSGTQHAALSSSSSSYSRTVGATQRRAKVTARTAAAMPRAAATKTSAFASSPHPRSSPSSSTFSTSSSLFSSASSSELESNSEFDPFSISATKSSAVVAAKSTQETKRSASIILVQTVKEKAPISSTTASWSTSRADVLVAASAAPLLPIKRARSGNEAILNQQSFSLSAVRESASMPLQVPIISPLPRTFSSPAKMTTAQKRRADAEAPKETPLLSSFLQARVLYGEQTPLPSAPLVTPVAVTHVRRALQQGTGGTHARDATAPLAASTSTIAQSESQSQSSTQDNDAFDDALAPLTAPSSFSSSSSSNPFISEIDYILDGCVSPELSLRHSSALKLVAVFDEHAQTLQRSQSLHAQCLFFLMRAHGGFDRLCNSFALWLHEPFMALAFAVCYFIVSRDVVHVSCLTAQAVEMLARLFRAHFNNPKPSSSSASSSSGLSSPIVESSSSVQNENVSSSLSRAPSKVRSKRRSYASTSASSAAADFDDSHDSLLAFVRRDPIFEKLQTAPSTWLLALLSIAWCSSDARVKALVAATSFCRDLPTFIAQSFVPETAASHADADATRQARLLQLQLGIITLENLTQSQVTNQDQALDAVITTSGGGSDATCFAALWFELLTHLSALVLSGIAPAPPVATAAEAEVDPDNETWIWSRVPSGGELLVALLRLLVNLTNKNPKGCAMLYRLHRARTGISLVAELAGNCWFHDGLRSERVAPPVAPLTRSTSRSLSPPPPAPAPLQLNPSSELVDVLTLSIVVILNIAEQSAPIRQLLLDSCSFELRTRVAVSLSAQQQQQGQQQVSAEFVRQLHEANRQSDGAESVSMTWLELMIDLFARAISAPATTDERGAIIARILASYAAMNLAVLATHDEAAFQLVQSKLRARPENTGITHRSVSPPLPPSHASQPMELPALQLAKPALSTGSSPSQPSLARPAPAPLILSMRLVARVLSEFLQLQSAGIERMSNESIDALAALVTSVQRAIAREACR